MFTYQPVARFIPRKSWLSRTGSSPASGTSFDLLLFNKMGRPEEAGASEISTAVKLNRESPADATNAEKPSPCG